MRLAVILCLLCLSGISLASPSDFAVNLCRDQPQIYFCEKIRVLKRSAKQYVEWEEKFPDTHKRQIAMLINRRNTLLWNGHIIAFPKVFYSDPLIYSPFPREKAWSGSKHIVVDLNKLAWAAYEPIPGQNLRARLVRWGVANGGAKICKETGRMECKTHPGTHTILKLYNAAKRSYLYPIDCINKKLCGHPMAYYMPFHKDGTGIHSDKWLVGRNASHGCVRLLRDDAKWLNKHFAFIGMPVVVENY